MDKETEEKGAATSEVLENIRKVGLVGSVIIITGGVLILAYIIMTWAPWPMKGDVVAEFAAVRSDQIADRKQQTQMNEQILHQLQDLQARQTITDGNMSNLSDDSLQMKQYLIDHPNVPFQPGKQSPYRNH